MPDDAATLGNGIGVGFTAGQYKVIKKYKEERGGQMQVIGEGHPTSKDLKTNIQQSIENGADFI